MYVDRSLELQGLVQAYSRTNRIHGPDKEFGSIINFQYPRMTEEKVDNALKLYGTGGTSSKAIVEPYETAVEKLKLKVDALKVTMTDPTAWQEIQDDAEKKEAFLLDFKDTAKQMQTVEQYYQYKWDNDSFGIDQSEWLNYIGAYRNIITDEPGIDPEPPFMPDIELGKTKIVGTQVIDANYILELIGEKAKVSNGKQIIDDESLRIIYQQIKELSNKGDHDKAELLKAFVKEELQAGKVESTTQFDEAFEGWKNEKKKQTIYELSEEWGINSHIFEKAVDAYSSRKPEDVPYMQDITKTLEFETATKPLGKSQLQHNMELIKELSKMIPKIKGKYE